VYVGEALDELEAAYLPKRRKARPSRTSARRKATTGRRKVAKH